MNRRNADFTLRYNERRRYPLVDDKLKTKTIAQENGLAVPDLYGVITAHYQLRGLERLLTEHPDVAIKPARGSGGEGIVILAGRTKERYRKMNGELIDVSDLAFHITNIISGMFSLGGQNDVALIEQRVRPDPVFEAISYQGVPDIRTIVFLGVPVMAMVRLPTMMSGGKANLHQGAIGAGIDMASGKTLDAVWRNIIVEEHPDTGHPVSGAQIPHWEKLMRLAAGCYELTGLGYIGVDQVLDENRGPLILELNARPGLNIQLANHRGLIPRLEKVETVYRELRSIDARVAFSRDQFKHAPSLQAV